MIPKCTLDHDVMSKELVEKGLPSSPCPDCSATILGARRGRPISDEEASDARRTLASMDRTRQSTDNRIMLEITQHRLTKRQIELLIDALAHFSATVVEEGSDDETAIEDALEALNDKIFEGEQRVFIQYVTGQEKS